MISKEMQDAVVTIRDFLDGRGDPWAWDDFLSIPARDQNVLRLQGFCRQLACDYPTEGSTEYCSKAGRDRLRAVADEIAGTL